MLTTDLQSGPIHAGARFRTAVPALSGSPFGGLVMAGGVQPALSSACSFESGKGKSQDRLPRPAL
jgi:hypothetical protein